MKPEKVIWILEDEPGSQFVYQEALGSDYPLRMFSTLGALEHELRLLQDPAGPPRPALLIADLRLPDGSFLEFVTTDRSKNYFPFQFPFVMVSSMDDMDALQKFFLLGARDYITKPFGKNEINVKVERLLDAIDSELDKTLFSINPVTLTVMGSTGNSINLTSKEFQILTFIHQAPKHTVAKPEIIKEIWGEKAAAEATLDVHLSNLRRKLGLIGLEIHFKPPHIYSIDKKNLQ